MGGLVCGGSSQIHLGNRSGITLLKVLKTALSTPALLLRAFVRDDSSRGKTFGSTPTITDGIKQYASIFIVIEAHLVQFPLPRSSSPACIGGTLATLQRPADADEQFLFFQRHHSLLVDGLLL